MGMYNNLNQKLAGGEREEVGEKGGGRGKGVMTPSLHAHMNEGKKLAAITLTYIIIIHEIIFITKPCLLE
jgi:hypothetical protein